MQVEVRYKENLINSIVEITQDYKNGTIMSYDHVNRWVEQFEASSQTTILSEIEHLLKNNYISRSKAYTLLEGYINIPEIFTDNFFQNRHKIKLLNIQGRGGSQNELLDLMDEIIKDRYNFSIYEYEPLETQRYIYLDDCMYTGNRLYRDIENWINIAKPNTTLYILYFAWYKNNFEYRKNMIEAICAQKYIKVCFWKYKEFSNNIFSDNHDFFWPSIANSYSQEVLDFIEYIDEKRTEKQRNNIPILRESNIAYQTGMFSSIEKRSILEKTFLEKGVFIFNLINEPNQSMKPMGYDYHNTLGFGSFFITYRNIANNCPIVLWWGDPNKQYPINQWYPLFPRTTNNL
ncbi:hypothetical protein QNH36_22505 [Mesobacillus sp. AQ2]|uniref:phosphoribosyltransferase-like protein n=1 Tax=Mesobacillus sp. AQ2 TaxID=3043332 RepID=UPI0024C18E75|nr:hypothetical protein [Mesobacillus sp. AQ2]WHX40379.1 hypothetical protein QNH36_22505 [Mesobacillus sp. AQ2]